ncbi:DUF3313 domain-containing protein [Metapseudomonas lalkuanensis]|uniref:DUF3313 domain-containing protein n=1 Tax=Metapseudomonas lalkuanensis TaxID=2604832 RepID=A0A5J6QL63_9GAMM|nr:DUF3313 domain-containing protein [Pseudomonas lalkuanensis]QEY62011.1 DUF3313 domain-containing protein [Pseudomonas lalkuanensis]UCO99793.1 DUF3313 domain-containing protein [Pseudomonas lalkuanensis]
MVKPLFGFALAAIVMLGSGCSSKVTQPEQYSGFLRDYSQLEEKMSASGQPVLRWTAPDFDPKRYGTLLVEKPVFHPAQVPSDQMSQQTMDQIATYMRLALQRELIGKARLVGTPEADTLIVRPSISAVAISTEHLKAYEVIPIALLAAATTTAVGTRDQEVAIYAEVEAVDAASGKPVVRAVRKGQGLSLENRKTPLVLDDLKPVLDDWARDARNFRP